MQRVRSHSLIIPVDRVKVILKLTLPVIVALVSNQATQLIDMAMVGALGDSAIAAIGVSSFTNAIVLAFILGFAPVIQGVIARRMGENCDQEECMPLKTGLLLVLLLGVPLATFSFFLSPYLFVSAQP